MPKTPTQETPAPGEGSVHQRLLEVAKDLFAADGYDNVSTSSIARRARTSESQLIKHFGGKEGLLEAIFDEGWQTLDWRVRLAWVGLSSPLDKFLALGDALITAMGEDRPLRTVMLLQGRRIRKRERHIVLSAGFRQFVQLLDGLFQEMRRAGQLQADLNLEAVRSALMGAVEALLRDQLMAELIDYPARYSREELLATFTRLVAALLEPKAARSLAQAAAARRGRP